jgi:Photosynthesis affected mutant 68
MIDLRMRDTKYVTKQSSSTNLVFFTKFHNCYGDDDCPGSSMKAMKTSAIIYFVICCFLLCYARTTTAFQSLQKQPRTIAWQLLATKKGFGKSTPEKSFQTVVEVPPATTVTPSVINQVESSTSVSSVSSGQEKSITTPRPKESSSATTTNAGQRALQELRRQRAEERDQELRMLRDMMTADEQIQNSGSASIPENVAQRMGLRMLPFVGIPFFGGMGAFITFWYLATYKNMEFEPTLVAASTIVLLVIGLLVSFF